MEIFWTKQNKICPICRDHSEGAFTSLWGIGHFSRLCVFTELAEMLNTSAFSSKPLMELNNTGPSSEPWGTLLVIDMCHWFYPLGSAIQPIVNPLHCPLTQSTLPVCLRGCCERQGQKLCWIQGGQYSLFFHYPARYLFHHSKQSGWSSITYL